MMVLALGEPAAAQGLVGSEITLVAILQRTPSAEPMMLSTVESARVSESDVEFPEVGKMELNRPGLYLVDTTIDISDRRISISFERAGRGSFLKATQNTYYLYFVGENLPRIETARVDRANTTLPIKDEDVSAASNIVQINVSGLNYDPSSRLTIDLGLHPERLYRRSD